MVRFGLQSPIFWTLIFTSSLSSRRARSPRRSQEDWYVATHPDLESQTDPQHPKASVALMSVKL